MSDVAGTLLAGRFRVIERLGAGGMGEVLSATDETTGDKVAIKRMFPHFAGESDIVARFEREARAVAKLSHPHVVKLVDFIHSDEKGSAPILAMELLEGETLRTMVIDDGPVAVGRAVKIAIQVLDALSAAHEAGIIHRDIKPDNVFVSRASHGGDFVKLLDFGVAKALEDQHEASLTETGALVGTLAFMAPEQARGDEVDARADLFGVGAVLYYALIGKKPHEAKGSAALLEAVLHEPIAPLDTRTDAVPAALARVVDRALAPSAEDRFASCEALIEALAPFVEVDAVAEAEQAEPLQREAATVPPKRETPARKKRAARLDVEANARALLAETTLKPKPASPLTSQRFVMLGLIGGLACVLVYVVALRGRAPDTKTEATAPPQVAPMPSATSSGSPEAIRNAMAELMHAVQAKDPIACNEALNSLSVLAPASAEAAWQFRAVCKMVSGDCDGGRAIARREAASRHSDRSERIVEAQAKRMAASDCPRDQLDADEQALAIKLEMLRLTEPSALVDAAASLADAVAKLDQGAIFRDECCEGIERVVLDLAAAHACDAANAAALSLARVDAGRASKIAPTVSACSTSPTASAATSSAPSSRTPPKRP